MKIGYIVAGLLVAAAVYFALATFFLPQIYSLSLASPKPAPMVTGVALSDNNIALGTEFSIRVSAANGGDPADLQLLSVAFPNATSTDIIVVRDHDFKQSPFFVEPGSRIAAGYTGIQSIVAAYPAVEAVSRPWEPGEAFNIHLSIKPENPGRFVIFVKAVALPHSGNQAHYPDGGIVDQQDEYVAMYEVAVTKS